MTRRKSTRGLWTVPVAASLGALGAGALAMTAVRTSLDRAQRELADLESEIAQVTSQIEDLTVAVDVLVSPRFLEQRARALGMRKPRADQVLRGPVEEPAR